MSKNSRGSKKPFVRFLIFLNISLSLSFTIFLTSCSTTEPPPPSIQPIDEIPMDKYPDWSPTGEWIAYEHEAVDFNNDTSGIYIIRPDGTNKHLIIPGGYHPSWAPDGRKIAFSATTFDGQIWIFNLTSSAYRKLTSEGFNIEPAWSNKGDRIAFLSGISTQKLIISDTNGVVLNELEPLGYPSWSSNDDSICGNVKGILTILELSNFLTEKLFAVNAPDWHPFSDEIVYDLYDYILKKGELYIIKIDSGNNRKLNTINGFTPCWSDDGSQIVYSSNIGKKVTLFIIKNDGTNNRQLTN
ncbi:MAG TPA: hypothetical protein VMT35_08655 [Ignavibacteriaceae bacterium]|nr:hypothetical protein [Ignavibacteriaceae bacterium]